MKTFLSALAIGLLLTSGCTKTHTIEDSLGDYQRRLYRVFEVTPEPLKVATFNRALSQYPKPRLLKIDIEPLNITLLDMLRLSDCEVNRLIGQHNNTLSKFQGTEEALFYDIEFIRLVEQCIASRDENSALRQKLSLAKQQKLESLPVRLYNGVFVSKELGLFFSVATEIPPVAHLRNGLFDSRQALESIARIAKQVAAYKQGSREALTAQKKPFNEALGVLATRKTAGQWLLAMQYSIDKLGLIERQVTQARSASKTCKKTPTGRSLVKPHNRQSIEFIFYELYIKNLQQQFVYLAQSIDVVRLLSEQASVGGEINSVFSDYWQATWGQQAGSVSEKYLRAIIDHSSFWQGILADCGIRNLPAITQ